MLQIYRFFFLQIFCYILALRCEPHNGTWSRVKGMFEPSKLGQKTTTKSTKAASPKGGGGVASTPKATLSAEPEPQAEAEPGKAKGVGGKKGEEGKNTPKKKGKKNGKMKRVWRVGGGGGSGGGGGGGGGEGGGGGGGGGGGKRKHKPKGVFNRNDDKKVSEPVSECASAGNY